MRTLKCKKKSKKIFFAHEKLKKPLKKVAQNQPRPLFPTVQPRPRPTAQIRFSISWNFGTRQVFSYLCYAAICGLFVNNLPDINPEYLIGVTPYHFAAMNGHVAIWELFLNHLEDKNPASQVDKAFTPFHYAAQNGHFETCQLFLEKLENKNPTCQYGITPFYLASEKGHFEICRLMIDNIHSKNLETKLKNIGSLSGRTSLHAAAKNGHLKVYKLLLENLKNKTPEDDYGKTPFDLAKESGHTLISEFSFNGIDIWI